VELKHVMIDIETLGTRPGDIILSIGAVKFDANGLGEEFYVTINPESSKAIGLRAQKSTLEWWDKQSPEAKAAAFKGEFSIEAALLKLTMWMPPKDVSRVWGNGPSAADIRAMSTDTRPLSTDTRLLSADIRLLSTDNRLLSTAIRLLSTDNRLLSTDNRLLSTDNRLM